MAIYRIPLLAWLLKTFHPLRSTRTVGDFDFDLMKNELLLWKSANSLWYAQPTSDDTSLLRTLSKLIRRQKLLVLFSKKEKTLLIEDSTLAVE